MRRKGKIRSWNDDKGFGFIVPSDGSEDVFLHISAFSHRNRRPETGQMVSYVLAADARGRQRASEATLPGDLLSQIRRKSGTAGALILSAVFLGLVALSVFFAKIPALILWLYLAASLVTYFAYAFDKKAAKDGAWRIQESTLHWLSLVGGWPGAMVAQQKLRHKSRKQAFRSVFLITVFVNIGAFAWVVTPTGAGVVQSLIDSGQQYFGLGQRASIEWAEPRE